MMDTLDKKILDCIQRDIPITSRPFQQIAEEIGSSEQEVLARIKRLQREKIIRRIGASFDSQQLGYHSVLVAACVPDEKLEQTVAMLNRYTGITHNYQREHNYNVWFTLSAASEQRVAELLDQIKHETGIVNMYPLPSLKKFKIQVHFTMEKGNSSEQRPSDDKRN